MSAAAQPRGWAQRGTDAACMVAALAIGVLGFGPLFGGTGYLVAGLGGLVLGALVALAAVRLRLGLLFSAVVVVAVYFVFGAALADRDDAIAGVVPSPAAAARLALGAVESWKQLLTAHPPVGVFPELLIAPYFAGLVCGAVAVAIAVRARRSAWALVPIAVLFVLPIVFGTDVAAHALLRGLGVTALCIGWLAWRRAETRAAAGNIALAGGDAAVRRRLRNRALGSAAVLGVIALAVGAGTGFAATPAASRHVLRDVVQPPVDVHSLASPLTAYRKYVSDKSTVLFTVTGLPKGGRIRLATLDGYDGIVYSAAAAGGTASGDFTAVGQSIPQAVAPASVAETAKLTFTIGSLTGVWLPDAGYLRSVSFAGADASSLTRSLAYDQATGTAVVTSGLEPGASYTVTTDIPRTYSAAQLAGKNAADVALPEPTGVPDAIGQLASKYAGSEKSAVAKLEALQNTLSTKGFFSDGLAGEATSRAGHGNERIESMLTSTPIVGDDEQYSVAMALMARNLGLPARVVMGFYPKSVPASGTVKITGADLHAWVEVDIAGAGWVAFDPTPPTTQVPTQAAPKPNPQPKSQVLQPPPVPKQPAQPATDSSSKAIKSAHHAPKKKNPAFHVPGAVIGAGAGVLGLLVLLFGPALVIGLLKARRRRARLTAARAADRLSGGWDELVDRAVDLGVPVPAGGTRREHALALAVAAEPRVAAIAQRADAGVFGPGDPSEQDIAQLWHEVDAAVGELRTAATARARLAARLSLRGLRRKGMTR